MAGRRYLAFKRMIDVIVAGIVLVASAPILVIVAAAVGASMGRPILFRQRRPGLHGEPFTLIKFRTMKAGDGPDADRMTRVGRFLRSTSLDELPELWNILRGDMSLVGPRPLLMEYLPLYDDRQATRHEVRPGLTGLAQTNGRNSVGWEERLELDAAYVERCSPALDMKILARTVAAVLRRNGIAADGHVTMQRFTGSRPVTRAEPVLDGGGP